MRLNAVGLGIVKRWGRGGAGGRKGRGGSEGALREDLGKASEGVNQFFNSLLTYSLKETLLRNKHFVSSPRFCLKDVASAHPQRCGCAFSLPSVSQA